MPHKDVELIERRVVFQGYYRVEEYRLRHRQHAGGMGPEIRREVFERGDAVAVLPYDPVRDEVVLIEQFRIGPYLRDDEPWMLEIVAGIIDEGEALEDVAHREAKEESGLELMALEPMLSYYTSPGAVTEHLTMYVAKVDATKADGIHGLDHEGEDIRVLVMTFDEAMAALKAGRITNSPALISLQWLALKRDDLRRRWQA